MRKLDSIFKRFYSKQSEYNCSKITIEDLKIKKMKESDSKHLNKLIPDVSWNSLITKLKYKAEMHNTIIREINPAFSSQRCYQCGYTEKSNRISQSEFHCKVCSYSNNADRNASLNILNYDLWSLKQKTIISLWKSKYLLFTCEEQEH